MAPDGENAMDTGRLKWELSWSPMPETPIVARYDVPENTWTL